MDGVVVDSYIWATNLLMVTLWQEGIFHGQLMMTIPIHQIQCTL